MFVVPIKMVSTLQTLKFFKPVARVLMVMVAENKKLKFIKFLKYVNLNLENMSKEEHRELKKTINSNEGRKLLFKYLEEVTSIDSDIAMMALTLLFCEDPEFDFDLFYEVLILKALKQLDDQTINFFIRATRDVELQKNKKLPYDRVTVSSNSCLLDENWNQESVGIVIRQLQELNLLLPDPCSTSPYAGSDDNWMVEYGISDNTRKIASLFDKARLLSSEYELQQA
ncbi:hypothetical protein [Psychrobacter sp.]|uniref:hypothetical protein n=1 Tax=Psychrobacter sp. TaxID=56811 RepID=UPI0025E99949|nr:hypothetical protein [Psychrobacter sp.]